jgi:pimeloyl-ACP methyl ester carboxylesterase
LKKTFEKDLTKIKIPPILNHRENIMIKHFSYNGTETLAYNDFGNEKGFPILVQHGTMASIKDIGYFDELQKVARVICIARPGYGESSPYILKNILEYGTIVSKLVETLSIKQFDIFSSSAGAPYVRYCERMPK